MSKKMKVVLLEPFKEARIAEIDGSLSGMQKIVGGYIEAYYPFEEEVCIICNDEGKINGLPPSRVVRDEDGKVMDVIMGTAFICDCSGEDFGSLSEEQLKKYKEKFLNPVIIAKEIHSRKPDKGMER